VDAGNAKSLAITAKNAESALSADVADAPEDAAENTMDTMTMATANFGATDSTATITTAGLVADAVVGVDRKLMEPHRSTICTSFMKCARPRKAEPWTALAQLDINHVAEAAAKLGATGHGASRWVPCLDVADLVFWATGAVSKVAPTG
jgi:hypothetical protein